MSMINQDDTNNSDNTSESKSDDQGNMKNDNDEESFDSSFVPESLRAFLDEANANLENTKASFDAQAIENKDGHVRIDGAMKYEGDQDDDSQIPSGEEPPQQQPQQLNNLHHDDDDDDDDDGTTNETRTTAARRSQDTSISNKDNDTKDNKLNSPFNSFEKKNKWNTDGDKNHNDVSSSDDGDDDDINIPYLQHVLSNTTSTVMYHQQQQQQHMNGSTRTPPPPLNRRNSYDDDDTDNSHYFLASSSDNSVSGAENRMGNNRKKGVHTRNSSGSGGGGGDSSDNHSENSSGLLQQPRGLALLTNEGSESTATAGAPSQEEQRLYQHHHHHHHHQNDRRQQQNNENDNNNSHNVLPTNHQHHEQRYRMVTPVFSAEQQQHPQYSSHPPPPPPHQQTQQQPSLPTHMLGGFVQQQLQQRIKTPPPPNNAYASSPDWNASLSSRESPHRAWKQQQQHHHHHHQQQYMVDLQFSPDHLEYIDRRHQSPSPLEMEEAELATTPHENTGIESQQRPQDQQQYASLSNNSNKSSTIHGVAEGEKTDHDGPFALPLIPSMGTDSSRSQEQQQLQQQQQQQQQQPLRYQPPLQSNGRHMQHQLQQYPQQQQHPHMMVPIKDDSLNSHPRMTATGERHNSEGDYAAGGGSSNSGEQQYPKNTISRDNNSPSTSSSPTLSQQERTNNFFENLQRESIGALQEAPPGEHAGGGDSDSRATPTPSEQAALQQQDEEGQQDQKQSGEADSTTEHEEVNNVNNGQQTPSSSSSSKPTSTSRRRRIFSTVDSVMRNVVSSVRAPRKSKKAKQQEEQQQEDVQQEQQQKLEDEEQPLINHQVEQNGFGGGGGGGGGGEGSFSAIELTLSISPDDNGAANINNNDTATLTQRIGTNNNHINDGDKQDGIAGKRFAPRFNEYKQRQARRLPTSGRSSSSGYSSGGSNSGSGSYQSGDDKPIYSPPTMGQRNDEQKERQQHGSSERSSFLQQQQNNSDWWSVSESSLSSAGPSNIRGNHPRFTSSPAISTAFDRPSLEYQVQRGAQSARDLRSAHSNDAYYNDRNHLLESARRYSSSKSLNPQPNLFSPGQQSHASSDFSWISPHNNAPSNASRRATDDLYDRARAMSPLLGPCPSSSGSSRSARSRSGSSYSVCSRSSSGTETSGKYDDEDGEGLMTVQSFRARDPSDQQVLRQVVHNAPPLPQNPAAGVVGSMGLGIGTKFQNYRTRFTPEVQAEHATKYPTFICPNCGTKQREFFTVNTADLKETGPAAYMAIYFIIYVVASLYIFGLQEGWAALDCVYFAVITLTTAGLGDFVPTSDAAKVICSIFIYFGVATIGLLLGSYLAGSLDEASRKEARDRRAKNCRTCERMRIIKTQNEAMSRRSSLASHHSNVGGRRSTPDIHMRRPSPLSGLARAHSERLANCKDDYHRPHQAVYERGMNKPKHRQPKNADSSVSSAVSSARSHGSDNNIGLDMETVSYSSLPSTRASPAPSHDRNNVGDLISPVSNINPKDTVSPPRNPHALPPLGVIDEFSARSESHPSIAASQNGNRMHPPDSPSTGHILNRQRHTRHVSLDRKDAFELVSNIERNRNLRGYHTNRMPSPNLSSSWAPHVPSRGQLLNSGVDESSTSGSETTTSSSSFYSSDPSEESFLMADDVQNVQSRTKTAKYVFLTLKLAVTNSFLIIFIGSVGFYFIEKMTMVDSFYFTTTLLTTVGYGDIVPVTPPGKLFATIYVLGAGTVLLHNMSLISMIPLELRKRRIERAVLSQFGDQLDDAALRELATGPLVKRLQLSTRRYSALDECTREMFALAMLVRLGKVTEHDIRMTFAAFRKLDVNDDGVLDSQDIIVGMVRKRQASMGNLQAASTGQEMNTSRERTPAQSSTAWKWSGNPAPYYETAPQGGPFSQEYESESSCTEQEQSDREPLLQNDHHHGVQNNYSSVGLNIDYSPQHQPEPSFFLEQPPTMDMMNQPPQNLLSASSFCSEDVSRERHPQQQNASSFRQSYQGYFNSPFSAYSDRE